jgi:hypothetical protein
VKALLKELVKRWWWAWTGCALLGANTGFALGGILYDKPLNIVVNGIVAVLSFFPVRDAYRDAKRAPTIHRNAPNDA